jgi:hypothetical protein
MPFARRVRLAAQAPRCALLLTAALALPPAAAQDTPSPGPDTSACAVLWQITALPGNAEGGLPELQLGLRFQAGQRQHSGLHLPGGWSGHTALPDPSGDAPRLQPRPGEPAWRDLAHAPGETVQLHWRLQPAGDATRGGHVQIARDWFALSGRGVLPMPEDADDSGGGPACVALQGMGDDARWASSHGTAQGPGAVWVLGPSPVPLAERVQQALYAGGALQWQHAPGMVAVLPVRSPWPMAPDAMAQAGAQVLAAQQRQWPQPADQTPEPPWLLLVLPAEAAGPRTGLASAWHQALALQLPPAWAGGEAALQALLTQAIAAAWTAERFGPLAHAGRGDAPLRAWFSDGWAGYLAHRSLLRAGLWSPDDYAGMLNARIAAYLAEPARAQPNAAVAAGSMQSPQLAMLQAMRGEWLALQWHLALRRAGHPGLDAVLRQQLVPAAQARREGPISAPLATHRVVATLRAMLRDQPLRDLQLHIEQGQPFSFDADSLGPCFQPAAPVDSQAPPSYQPVADALHQPECQGWLGLGPLADGIALPQARAAAHPRPGSRQAARKARSGKAAARPGGKAGGKSSSKPSSKSSQAAARPASQPKTTRPSARPAH